MASPLLRMKKDARMKDPCNAINMGCGIHRKNRSEILLGGKSKLQTFWFHSILNMYMHVTHLMKVIKTPEKRREDAFVGSDTKKIAILACS